MVVLTAAAPHHGWDRATLAALLARGLTGDCAPADRMDGPLWPGQVLTCGPVRLENDPDAGPRLMRGGAVLWQAPGPGVLRMQGDRLVLIEDSAELLPGHENVVSLIAERVETSARSADKLLEMTLRLRPDRIILGELRGVEAVTFLEAINTGHEGSFTTLHATTARKAVNRLAFLVMRAGMPLTLTEIRDYVRESIDVIVQTGRVGKERGILETYFPALDGENG